MVDVHMLGLPVRLLLAAREHHDGVMREFRLLSLAGIEDRPDFPTRLVALTQILGQRFGAARQRQDRDVDDAEAHGDDTLDLTYTVPASIAPAIAVMDDLMAEADAFCAAESLMSLERPTLLKEFGRWYILEFTRQAAGEPPTRWGGPVDL